DPNYSDAWAALADCIVELAVGGHWADWQEAATEGTAAASRAIRADPENGTAFGAAAWTIAMLGGSLEQAVEYAERALDLNPNSAYVHTCCAWAFIYNGESD